MSAYLRLGSTNCSCMGLTVVKYCVMTLSSVRPRSRTSRSARRRMRTSASVSTKIFDVKHFAQPRVLENEDALDDDDLARPDELGLIRALVVGVGVDGAADGLARLELLELLDHQVCFKGVWVVVVLLAALFKGPVLIFIIAVVVHDADIVAEVLLQMLGERRFARTGAACNANEDGVHRQTLHESLLLSRL